MNNIEPIEQAKFDKILCFILITSNSMYFLELSPDYILEKFEQLVDFTLIKGNDNLIVHPKYRQVIDRYYTAWSGQINRVVKIREFLD